jgi:hypothetical protein
MHSLKAFLLSLTCIALCFGRSVAQTQQTDSSTAPAASASSAAPAAAAPASPEQIEAAVAEIKHVAEEGQRWVSYTRKQRQLASAKRTTASCTMR